MVWSNSLQPSLVAASKQFIINTEANLRWTSVGRTRCARSPSHNRTARWVVRRCAVVEVIEEAGALVVEVEEQVALKKSTKLSKRISSQ